MPWRVPLAAGQRFDAPSGWCDPGAGPHSLHAVDHDAVVALQAGAHDAQAALEIARFDDALLGEIVLAERPHEAPRLIAQDRTIGHEHCIELARAEELKASKLT